MKAKKLTSLFNGLCGLFSLAAILAVGGGLAQLVMLAPWRLSFAAAILLGTCATIARLIANAAREPGANP